MRCYKLNAIIIKRRNFLEKDRILTLFSLEHGKMEALAKGARRPGNKLSPNSDLATAAIFHVHKTKSIDIISEIEPFFYPDGIRGVFDKTQKISYALKITDLLYELDEVHAQTYFSLLSLVKSISKNERQLIFLKFLLDVMNDLGAMPNFINCSHCHKQILPEDKYSFGFKGGLFHRECLQDECLEITPRQIKLLRMLSRIGIDEIKKIKVDSMTFESTYSMIAKYFTFEFGKILPDEVM